jgi:hypothetical protein
MASAFIVRPSRFARSRRRSIFCRPVAIVLDDELALVGLQLLQTAIEAFETPFFDRAAFVRFVELHGAPGPGAGDLRLVKRDMPLLAPDIFEVDKPRDRIAVAGWRGDRNRAVFLQNPADAIERLVRQVVCRQAIPAVEVRDESPAHLEVPFALGNNPVVQPLEQSAERILCEPLHVGTTRELRRSSRECRKGDQRLRRKNRVRCSSSSMVARSACPVSRLQAGTPRRAAGSSTRTSRTWPLSSARI